MSIGFLAGGSHESYENTYAYIREKELKNHIIELKRLLKEYGRHKNNCGVDICEYGRKPCCTCGFDIVLTNHKSKGELTNEEWIHRRQLQDEAEEPNSE